ncbi:MAG: hypothetical protein GXX10_01730 [Clostridiaceae bacterium]|nr:hypothetical protein [Clostridiaceae bacterium]
MAKPKQDHRMYTRAQVDYLRMMEAQRAIQESIPLYNCALVLAMTDKVGPEIIKDILADANSIFDSIKTGTLSFEDCAEDIRKNLGIEVMV